MTSSILASQPLRYHRAGRARSGELILRLIQLARSLRFRAFALSRRRSHAGGFKGYGADCWGITASDDPGGYDAHAPGNDNGTISPTAALSSFPYAPKACLAALRHFLAAHGTRVWGRFGFTDAFNETRDWWADTFLAIDQAPIILMMENYRSGLLWKLFMAVPEVRRGLTKLGFTSPYL